MKPTLGLGRTVHMGCVGSEASTMRPGAGRPRPTHGLKEPGRRQVTPLAQRPHYPLPNSKKRPVRPIADNRFLTGLDIPRAAWSARVGMMTGSIIPRTADERRTLSC